MQSFSLDLLFCKNRYSSTHIFHCSFCLKSSVASMDFRFVIIPPLCFFYGRQGITFYLH
ncbi:hypothetical protein Gohar_000096, partial [Gossypium harknessii]|nr:hypothetical protein [Gossypium harknessii]